MKLNRTGTPFTRDERNRQNENWTTIENDFNNVVDLVSNKAFKEVIDNAKVNYLEPVPLYADIANTYPNPNVGDTVELTDATVLGQQWRWDGANWVHIATRDASILTQEVNEARIGVDDTRYTTVKERLDAEYNEVNKKLTDIAINIKTPPIPMVGAKGNANYFNSADGLYYEDELFTTPANVDDQALIGVVSFLSNLGGGTVIFPKVSGGYIINNVTISDSNIEINFLGNHVIKQTGNGYALLFADNLNQENITLKNGHFLGDNTVIANGALGFATNAQTSQINGLTLENITCSNFAQYGINIGSVSDLRYKNIKILNHGSISVDATIGVGFIIYPKNEQTGIWGDNLYSEINEASTLTSAAVKIQVIKNGFARGIHTVNGTESSISIEATDNVTYEGLIIEKTYATAYPGLVFSSNNTIYSILNRSYKIKGVQFIGTFSSAMSGSVNKVEGCIVEDIDMSKVTASSGARIVCAANGGISSTTFRNLINTQVRLDIYNGTSSNNNRFENVDLGDGALTATGDNNEVVNIKATKGMVRFIGNNNEIRLGKSIQPGTNSFVLDGNNNRLIDVFADNPTNRSVWVQSGDSNEIINLVYKGLDVLDNGTNTKQINKAAIV